MQNEKLGIEFGLHVLTNITSVVEIGKSCPLGDRGLVSVHEVDALV